VDGMSHYEEQREQYNMQRKIKLIQGNSLEKMDQLIELGFKVDAIITDPPFNIVEKIGKNIHIFRQGEKQNNASISKESMSFDIGFDQLAWLERIPKILKKGGNLIIFNDWENMGDIAKALRKHKIKVKCLNHWQKNNPCPAEWGRRFVAGREYFLHCTSGVGYEFNVDKLHKGDFKYPLTKQSEKKHGKHPNQKPLNLMEELISILSAEGQTILDPFMGSGSTGVACVNTNRNFIGIELDETYFNIAKERINNS
jgi:site-specific DNA-methyltransferase (adenine-specific)